MPSGDYEPGEGQAVTEPLLEKTELIFSHSFLSTRWKAIAIVTGVLIIASILSGNLHKSIKPGNSNQVCHHLAVRQEWRALSSSERLEYLRAVRCLSSIPSTVCNGTLHDEFAYIHREIGDYSHDSAAFLPWHRYFLHIYEETLKQKCRFKGTLPYWDWTRDWMNLTESPVWDAKEGFGGDGNMDLPITVGHGRCVGDGPFAYLQVQYYSDDLSPHCLSRGFLTGKLQEHFGAQRLNNSAIAAILDESNYFGFLTKLEDGPHLAIPINVRGDFSRTTAPNDPIFFLHHAQLDRLWWKWQSQNAGAQKLAYNGPSRHNSSIAAQLADLIEMTGLAPDIPVKSVMDINDDVLCYRYQA